MTAHVLFSDATSAELQLELDPSPEPKVFVLGSPSREVLLSAERGANAAYLALRRRGLLKHAWASFFEMAPGAERTLPVLGESAGLAFALTFAAQALAREHSRARPIVFAATGVLASGAIRAEVNAVDAIDAKVAAAGAVLPAGASVFVPAANAAAVTDARHAELAAKGLRLLPVATVDEALAAVVSMVLADDGARRRLRGVGAGLAAALLVLLAWLGVRQLSRAWGASLARQVRAGEFAGLTGHRALGWLLPSDGGPLADARRELTLLLSLHSRSADTAGPEAEGVPELGPDDRYRLALETNRDCWLYAVQLDSWGTATLLFPNPRFSGETNPVHGARRYWVPDEERWLALDRQPGKETIVVVAAPWPSDDLEALFAQLPAGKGDAADVVAAIQRRSALRRAARLDGLRGVAYDEIVFAHR